MIQLNTYFSILQVIEVDSRDIKIHYFVLDSYNGFRKETKSYLIEESEILKELSSPVVKNVGLYRKSYVFNDLK